METTPDKPSWHKRLRIKISSTRIKLRLQWFLLRELPKMIKFSKWRRWLFWALTILLAFGLFVFVWQLWEVITWNFKLVKSLSSECPKAFISTDKFSKAESCSVVMRNFGLTVGIGLSFIGVGLGLVLAWWGRKIQQESHLQERFEKAAGMLSSELELTRIAACGSLENLGKSNKSMRSQCVWLLFAFIKNPYLKASQKKKFDGLAGSEKDKYLSKLFSADKALPSDINSAIESFSSIYDYYGKNGVDSKRVRLPTYFWKNKKRWAFSLIRANLYRANLRNAKLEGGDLQGVNLSNANLKKASMHRVNLNRANLQGAKLKKAILSAIEMRKANLQGAKLKKANLRNADLKGANLRNAKLKKANLGQANLRGVNLQKANLKGADISAVDMRKVKNLTKEQILSAKWGYSQGLGIMISSRSEFRRILQIKKLIQHIMSGDPMWNGPPQLPKNLLKDEEIKAWLEKPDYDEREKSKKSKAKAKAKAKSKTKATAKAKSKVKAKKPKKDSQ